MVVKVGRLRLLQVDNIDEGCILERLNSTKCEALARFKMEVIEGKHVKVETM